jgi:four helix bundle protein
MTNKEFAKKLELRTVKFAIEIINLSASLPKTTETLVIRNQLTKSGTSIGANYRKLTEAEAKRILKIK